MDATFPHDAPGKRARALFVAQLVATAIALYICFRGAGHPFWWLCPALIFPAACAILIEDEGRRALGWLRQLRQSVEAYPSPGSRTPWMAAFVFVVLPCLMLFLSNNRNPETGDTWPVIPTAGSLINERTWDLSAYVGQAPESYLTATADRLPYSTLRRGGRIVSSYPSGMVPFALPVVAAARLCGADLHVRRVQRNLEKWTASWLSAWSVGLFFLIALHLARPVPALVTTAFLAVGSVMFSTCGQCLWQQGGVIFWILLALFMEFNRANGAAPAGTLIQGIACAMMLACRLSAALFIAPFGLWILCRSPRRALVLTAAACLSFAPWAWMHHTLYGNLSGPAIGQLVGFAMGADVAEKLGLVLASPSRGILVYQPWLFLGALAFLPLHTIMWRRNLEPPGWQPFCLAFFILHIGLITLWNCWWGGNCWGSRLAAEIVPLAGLLCVRPISSLWSMRTARVGLAGLLLLSFSLHAVAMYGRADYWDTGVDINRHPEMLRSWSRPPFLYPMQSRRAEVPERESATRG